MKTGEQKKSPTFLWEVGDFAEFCLLWSGISFTAHRSILPKDNGTHNHQHNDGVNSEEFHDEVRFENLKAS